MGGRGRNNECPSDVDARLSKNPSHGTFEEQRGGPTEGRRGYHHLSEKVCPMQCHASHRTLPAVVLQRPRTTKEEGADSARNSALTASLLSPRR